ncbi:MAG TPA: hypothetical protein VHF70_00475 [Rubrobacteraceae bacterium]|nr:hypothetical protein [Rubrobacteraceae bacterium]
MTLEVSPRRKKNAPQEGSQDTAQATEVHDEAQEAPREGQEEPQAGTGEGQRLCLCDCRGIPKGKKSLFLAGHDARLRSELVAQIKKDDVLLRSDRITPEQRAFAVRHGLAGPEVLPEGEHDG